MTREYVIRRLASLDALHAAEWQRRADSEEKANAEWSAWLESELAK